MSITSFETKLKKGQVGERVVIERLERLGCQPQDLTDYSKHKKMQQKGLDFSFLDRKSGAMLRGDSKANILFSDEDKLGMTFMELTKKNGSEGWFWTSKSDYIFIYDPTFERSFFYDLDEMRKVFKEKLSSRTLKVAQLKDGCYGAWLPVDHFLIKGLV